jgi:tagaturonate reductase
MRNIPPIKCFFERKKTPPNHMSLGFAAFFLFMKVIKKEDASYWGACNEIFYEIKGDSAEYFFTLWQETNIENLVKPVLSNEILWEENLEKLPGFGEAVSRHLLNLIEKGTLQVIKNLGNKK